MASLPRMEKILTSGASSTEYPPVPGKSTTLETTDRVLSTMQSSTFSTPTGALHVVVDASLCVTNRECNGSDPLRVGTCNTMEQGSIPFLIIVTEYEFVREKTAMEWTLAAIS